MFSIVRGSQVLLKCHAAYGLEGAPLAFTAFYSLDIGKAPDVAPAPSNLSDGLSVTPDHPPGFLDEVAKFIVCQMQATTAAESAHSYRV
jgi:hypothetical protein